MGHKVKASTGFYFLLIYFKWETDVMPEEKLETIIRDYADALEKNDVDRALLFFTDDAVWYNPKGAFKGKEEIKGYMAWLFKTVTEIKFIDDGVGIIIQGNKGIFQHIFECTIRASKIRVPTFCTYLFDGRKCNTHWTIKTVDPDMPKIQPKDRSRKGSKKHA